MSLKNRLVLYSIDGRKLWLIPKIYQKMNWFNYETYKFYNNLSLNTKTNFTKNFAKTLFNFLKNSFTKVSTDWKWLSPYP